MWETESSPLNLPGSVRKPKAQNVGVFRGFLLFMRNLQDPRASIASHGCKCLGNKKTLESRRVEGFGRLALFPTHPLSDITEKNPRIPGHDRQRACVIFRVGLYCKMFILQLLNSLSFFLPGY